jgi:hypothetical protein
LRCLAAAQASIAGNGGRPHTDAGAVFQGDGLGAVVETIDVAQLADHLRSAFHLVRDLHDLFLLVNEALVSMTVLHQAAMATPDAELENAGGHSGTQRAPAPLDQDPHQTDSAAGPHRAANRAADRNFLKPSASRPLVSTSLARIPSADGRETVASSKNVPRSRSQWVECNKCKTPNHLVLARPRS